LKRQGSALDCSAIGERERKTVVEDMALKRAEAPQKKNI
jgi:hypothetical protein